MKILQRGLTALAVLVASLAVVGGTGASPAAAGPLYTNVVEASVINYTNAVRVKRGLPVVRSNACVDRMAEGWARHLASTNAFYHRNLNPVLKACNLSYVSENLAYYAVVPGMTASEVARWSVSAWMKSSGHRANLLSRRPRLIGVGVAKSADGNRWIVVQNFGRY